jgi:hypothetical protein
MCHTQLIEGQALEVGQGGIARAKVVQGEPDTMGFEGPHLGDDVLKIVE